MGKMRINIDTYQAGIPVTELSRGDVFMYNGVPHMLIPAIYSGFSCVSLNDGERHYLDEYTLVEPIDTTLSLIKK